MEETGRNYTTIARWVRRFEEEGGDGIPQRCNSGRPPWTSAEQDAAMVKVASRHTFMPPQDVAAAAGVDNINVSLLSTRLKCQLQSDWCIVARDTCDLANPCKS